jgi:hypothetical protein
VAGLPRRIARGGDIVNTFEVIEFTLKIETPDGYSKKAQFALAIWAFF